MVYVSAKWLELLAVAVGGVRPRSRLNDGIPKTVTFTLDEAGQIIRRDETNSSNDIYQYGDPHEVWYRFAGAEMGYTGNNGTSNLTTPRSISERIARAEPEGRTGTFRGGSNTGEAYVNRGGLDPLNSYYKGSRAGTYTVRGGESLQQIAASIYGDSNLWYKIAQANGLSGSEALTAGMTLRLPTGVVKSTHNASTFKPYDPGEAIGELSPTTPKPAKGAKCGVFGAILSTVVAVAASYVFGPIWGNVVSQGFNNIIGIQSGFSFKSLAISAISAGVTAGVDSAHGTGAMFGSQFAGDVIRGAASNAITQGISTATGLQDKFSWTGVAAAGVSAGVGGAVLRSLSDGEFAQGEQTRLEPNGFGGIEPAMYSNGSWMPSLTNTPSFGVIAASGAASSMANAVTRSALSGENFGKSLVASIPDVVG